MGVAAIVEMVNSLKVKLPVDPDRIYITGFSMGASIGWLALMAQPQIFAAAALFSGVPPERSTAPQFAGTPMLIVHGNADPENPFAPDRVMFAALEATGQSKARFREYDNLPHTAPADVLTPTTAGDW